MFKLFLLTISLVFGFSNTAIDYINELRQNSGLNILRHTNLLDNSSMNHLLYLKDKNIFSHKEFDKNNKYFTGETPTKRVNFLGHHGFALENMSKGDSNAKMSIDNLFSAIYHRFSFLSPNIDEIGMAKQRTKDNKENIFVFNMANSYANQVCKMANFQGFGRFYHGVCIDKSKRIGSSNFLAARDFLFTKNPEFVTYPYNYQSDIQPYFLEEVPDPLPECSISGYPISIGFNPLNFKRVNLQSFSLFKITKSAFQEIKNVKILTKRNDKKFKKYQFTLMPLDMLDWGSRYLVLFKYRQNDEDKEIRFHFSTRKLPYPSFIIDNNNKTLRLKANKKNYVFIKPKNCNARLKKTRVSYNASSNQVKSAIEKKFVNVISIYAHNLNGKTINVKVQNNLYDFKARIE